ncbi:MAG: hypothetical protein E7220_04960 [Clostridiales bacterium]|nr:hypothetical protein [Clostridiales bacterium]
METPGLWSGRRNNNTVKMERIIEKRSTRMISFVAAVLLAASLLLQGCAGNGAESTVKADLEALRNAEIDKQVSEELEGMLSASGREDLKTVLGKIGEFEYEITDSHPSEGDESEEIVTVRIKTYSFGWEYLRTWNGYLEDKNEEEFDQKEFYDMLMKNLSGLESKSYYKDVEIECTDDGDGEWQSDASYNKELKDAILGGMLTEIEALADL